MSLSATPAHLATAPDSATLARRFPSLPKTDVWHLPEWLAHALNGLAFDPMAAILADWAPAPGGRPFLHLMAR